MPQYGPKAHAIDQETLCATLRHQIATGDLRRGDRLLPERELSHRLGLSRARLRQALDQLETEGLLFRRRGQGTFVKPPPATEAGRLKSLALRVSPKEVMEVRLEIEPALAGLAAERATDQARQALSQITAAILNPEDQAAYEAADDLFHYKIAEMAQNPLFLMVYESIRSIRTQADWSEIRAETYSPAVMTHLGHQHQLLAQAILVRDSAAASQIMRDHLETVSRILHSAPQGEV